MSYVAGIDQSANHTGVCVLTEKGELVLLELIEPVKLKDQARLAFIRTKLNALLAPFDLQALVMEGYSHGSLSKKFLLGEVGSIVKLTAYDMGAPLHEAAPTQLKKFVTGKGSADKDAVMKGVKNQWKMIITDDNLADAYGLAQIAREIVWPSSSRRYQLDVVKNITKKDLNKRKSSRIKVDRNAI